MPNPSNAPADTTMMRIVHDALRRDLRRAHDALTSDPPPDDAQRIALAHHLHWMMSFLEAHHRSEDVGLYRVVRERRPDAVALLDDMARDHDMIATAVDDVAAAAGAYAERDERQPLVDALDRLSSVLVPHLRREEDEAMPVVSSVVTSAEWSDLEHKHNLDGKSMHQLGFEGHWLIDDASPDDRRTVLDLVPPVPRVLLLYGFRRSYRRHWHACWKPRRRGVQKRGVTSVVTPTDIEAVWDVVRDPTRVGEWSHECVAGEWVGDLHDATPGARFRGRNKQGLFRWGRLCEILRAEPHQLVWRTVPGRLYPDSTEWAIRLQPVEGGTEIEQSFRVVKGSKLEPLYARLLPAHRDRTEALRGDLHRIGILAAAAAHTPLDRHRELAS